MQDAPKDIGAIKDYHAHVYYDPASKDRAALLRKWVEERFTMRMGSWHDEPVGPHVQAMYQIAFAPDQLPLERRPVGLRPPTGRVQGAHSGAGHRRRVGRFRDRIRRGQAERVCVGARRGVLVRGPCGRHRV